MTVTVGEAHVGHVTAMALIAVVWSFGFWAGVLEEVDFTEVVGHRHHSLIVGATEGVDVCTV